MTMTLQFAEITFLDYLVSLFNFSYCSNFYVNIMTGSGVLTIFCYKRLTGNPEIRNTLVLVLSNVWRLEWLRVTKFTMNVSNEILLNDAKCQVYNFQGFWFINGKRTEGDKIPRSPLPPATHTHTPKLGLIEYKYLCCNENYKNKFK